MTILTNVLAGLGYVLKLIWAEMYRVLVEGLTFLAVITVVLIVFVGAVSLYVAIVKGAMVLGAAIGSVL